MKSVMDLYRLSASVNYRKELFIIHWGENGSHYVKVSRLDFDFTDMGQYVLSNVCIRKNIYIKLKLFPIVFVFLCHCLILNGIQVVFNMHR